MRRSPARLVIALSVAAALAVFILYTSVAGAGTPQIQPSDLAAPARRRAPRRHGRRRSTATRTRVPACASCCATRTASIRRRACRRLPRHRARPLRRRPRGRRRQARSATARSSPSRLALDEVPVEVRAGEEADVNGRARPRGAPAELRARRLRARRRLVRRVASAAAGSLLSAQNALIAVVRDDARRSGRALDRARAARLLVRLRRGAHEPHAAARLPALRASGAARRDRCCSGC